VASFAGNPDKAWAERFLLAVSPLWIAAVAIAVLSGVLRGWNDAQYLVFSCACAAPAAIGPALVRGPAAVPLSQRYWVKLNVWVAIVVFFGTYIGTHYFFDLMGMRYAFGSTWNLQSQIVGQSGQRVPVFMYPLTHAYFMTYFTLLVVADRTLRAKLRPGPLGRALIVAALSYAIAFAETFFMATDMMRDLFAYEQKDRMLALGSIGYALYFVVGLPMVRRMDEGTERWSLGRVVLEALATCMAILLLLELWAQLVGPL
jgi:cycloeucalenol cycloisomerase